MKKYIQPADPDPAASDAYVAELRRDLSALLYSTYLGGTGFDQAFGVAARDHGAAYVTGWTDASNFPTTPGAFQPADPNPIPGLAGRDVFVTKLRTVPAVPPANRAARRPRGRASPGALPHTAPCAHLRRGDSDSCG